jgi:NTE family protein
VPEGVEVHVLPARGTTPRDDSLLAHRDFSRVAQRIDASYEASRDYLTSLP